MHRAAPHARHTFEEIEASGPATRPLDFPRPALAQARAQKAIVIDPDDGTRCSKTVIHRLEIMWGIHDEESVAYLPQKKLKGAIYGSVWVCLVLRIHHGPASDQAAREMGVEPGNPNAPLVWELTPNHVAMKKIERSRVPVLRCCEDPFKEVSAMQWMGTGDPHVISSLDALQDRKHLYSIMPYCAGGHLFGYVVRHKELAGRKRKGCMSELKARYWFRQILKGLHRLQSRGVCHRDVSLENILIDEKHCIVMDFGMCLRVPHNDPLGVEFTPSTLRRLMTPQGACGKPYYMSPEVYANRDNFDGYAIDLWAAGSILFIMLAGMPPFHLPVLDDPCFKLIVNGQLVELLNAWGITVSQNAGDLLQNMFQLDPRNRLTLAQVMEHPWVVHGPN